MDIIEIDSGTLEVTGEPLIEIVEVGPISVGGGGGSGGSHIHTQASPSLTWTITHTLGYRPAVSVLDVDNNELDAAIAWPNVSTVTVTLAASTAGKALLS